MKEDPEFATQYKKNIDHYLQSGYGQEVSRQESEMHTSRICYLPHFGVRNLWNPNKLRLVSDTAASVNGTSLNSILLIRPHKYQALRTSPNQRGFKNQNMM